jgi:hypothetical protein
MTLFPNLRLASIIKTLRKDGGDRLRQEPVTSEAMHAGLPYAAR